MPSFVPSKYCIRTSGRRTFRRCMRKWGYLSSMRMNLSRKGTEQNINFWFGSGIHFALEDFFGPNKFGDPREAFKAYYNAFPEDDLPPGAEMHYDLGISMLDYFLQWYPKHNMEMGFETLWLNDYNQPVEPNTPGSRPLVEEAFILDLNKVIWVREDTGAIVTDDPEWLKDYAGSRILEDGSKQMYLLEYQKDLSWGTSAEVIIKPERIYYHGTIDRIVVDKHGRWWLWDWKTAKGADTNKLDTDDQISAYMWAAEQWLQHPIYGFVYFQMTKDIVKSPKRLKNGTLSIDKKQKTTYQLVKQAVVDEYGSVQDAPEKYIEFVNHYAEQEDSCGDKFIRWDFVTRNQQQKESTYKHIMGEVNLMCNPNLYLFPNPTRDCIWDCPFRDACIKTDEGKIEEVNQWINENFEQRPHSEDGDVDPWRKDIVYPEKPVTLDIKKDYHSDMNSEDLLEIILPEKYK